MVLSKATNLNKVDLSLLLNFHPNLPSGHWALQQLSIPRGSPLVLKSFLFFLNKSIFILLNLGLCLFFFRERPPTWKPLLGVGGFGDCQSSGRLDPQDKLTKS